ncbi:hypothetical protein HP499_15825 [Paenarthrobacter sp. CM16]|uniref:hypothetical protein n=1 Tax=Paenarthrobacter sp. CM16 TaxID=2738447 RepID=UPI001557F24C|nr:hypothetical protein [Paenarthrobacter sp. CM16]NQD89255.1 hypothetical protein [Paenarthrobacter sp. CM16]
MAGIKDRRPPNGTSRGRPPGERASMAALFVTILAVSVGLALWADIHIVLRWLIAIVTGITTAGITLAVIKRRESQKVRKIESVE